MKARRNPFWRLIGVAVCAAISVVARGAQVPQAGIEFIRIAPGSFQMGCGSGDSSCKDNEKPAHPVRISKEFDLGKYEVTQAQWQAVMGSNPSHFKGDQRPVEFVSWAEAQEFIMKLNMKNDGYRYRLPTEAEWEYAARAGTMHEGLLETAHYGRPGGQPLPVGSKKPNAWGLYDMLGNVEEWVEDWYDQNSYSGGAVTDPKGPSNGQFKVLRGGSYLSPRAPNVPRVSFRAVAPPTYRGAESGFRLIREISK